MDRQIVYVGAVPLDTDQLLQARNAMVALGYLAKMTIGDGTAYADGLACTPGGGLTVAIAPGSMTLPTTIDVASYGALPPDGDLLLKVGINTASTALTLPGTGTTVISGCVVESQAGSAAVAYYNSANPTQTLIGAQGNGQAQATVIQARVSFAATAPGSVPSGFMPLWQIVVPPLAVAVTAAMITAAAGAPFIAVKLPQAAPIISPAFLGNPTAPTVAVGDASASLATTSFVSAAVQRNRAAWGSGGTYSWSCPAGVSSILVRAWAAGGTGGASASGYPGGGGGGGGYIEVLIPVTAGMTYALQIGSGTSGSTTTSFDQRVIMSGGGSGQSGGNGQSGTGGVPGAPVSNNLNSVASIGVSGGQSGYQLGGISVGGAGGASYGVQGATASIGGIAGIAGTWPGGGGSGGATGTAGRGADGFMSIEWNG
ncbi:hypothetical protein [Lichenicola sp.]|uniref:glycine-rich domain-containing protein n=1 Tax=Lichenicola sp. TaxID=2804529 RepID=UPI003AFFEE95